MGLFIVAVGGFIIYFFFIKKGESGTTILNHRKEIHKYVQQHGGMVKLYQEIVDYFIGEDFEIREVTKDYIYLHYGTSKGKVGVEILQMEVKKAQVTVGVETAHGAVNKQEIEVHSEADSKEAIQHIKESLDLFDRSNHVKNNPQIDKAAVDNKQTSSNSRRGFAGEFDKMMKTNREKFEVEISEQKGDELYRSGEYAVAAYVYLALYNENLHVPEYIIKCINSHVRMGK